MAAAGSATLWHRRPVATAMSLSSSGFEASFSSGDSMIPDVLAGELPLADPSATALSARQATAVSLQPVNRQSSVILNTIHIFRRQHKRLYACMHAHKRWSMCTVVTLLSDLHPAKAAEGNTVASRSLETGAATHGSHYFCVGVSHDHSPRQPMVWTNSHHVSRTCCCISIL